MGSWVVSTLNQLFVRDSYTEIKFKKKKVVRVGVRVRVALLDS